MPTEAEEPGRSVARQDLVAAHAADIRGVAARYMQALRRRAFAPALRPDLGSDREGLLAERARNLARLNAQLTELDRVRNWFLSVLAHDLRSPIATALGAIDVLLGNRLGALTADQREFVDMARRNCRRALDLANDLLDLQRIHAGALVLEPSPTELGPLVRHVVEELMPAAAERRVRVQVRGLAGPAVAAVDADRLAQAVRNLIANALRFADREVIVGLARDCEHAGEFCVSVEDDGPGVRPEAVEQIFEPFGRSAPTGPQSGTGLGLAIVRAIAEAHGGRVSVQNRPGCGIGRPVGGARFVLFLPAAAADHPDRRPAPAAS